MNKKNNYFSLLLPVIHSKSNKRYSFGNNYDHKKKRGCIYHYITGTIVTTNEITNKGCITFILNFNVVMDRCIIAICLFLAEAQL